MTLHMYQEIDCPHCGAKDEVLVWSTINAQVSPEDKAALLNANINMLMCNQCKIKTFLDRPLLYHDMEIGYMAWYFPFASVRDGTILNSVDPDGHIKGIELYPECEYATAVHYVFDMDELVRYVRFRDVLAQEMRRAG